MKAIILAGGKGTRLRPLTDNIPKALVKINDKTITEHLLDLLKKYNVTEIFLSVGHMSELIKDYFKDGRNFGVSITYLEESEPLGTAGPLKLAKELLDDNFIVSNGDELKDIDLEKMKEFHLKNKSIATLSVLKVNNPSEYGTVVLDNNKIIKFLEKVNNPPTNMINAGFYMMEPEILDYIPNGFAMFEKDVFPKLAEKGKLFGFEFKGQWFDTGNIERLERARREWKSLL